MEGQLAGWRYDDTVDALHGLVDIALTFGALAANAFAIGAIYQRRHWQFPAKGSGKHRRLATNQAALTLART